MTVRCNLENLAPVVRPLANTATQTAQTALLSTYAALGQTSNTPTPVVEGDLNNFNHDYGEDSLRTYWYHPDHLGSSSYITNVEGIVTQHIEYMPYGEPSLASSPTPKKTIAKSGQSLVEEHQNSINTPYKFNGKEQDDETGNYYYGARYYNPKFSFWLSVDPLAEKFYDLSPYAYVSNNPLRYTDPTGMGQEDIIIHGSNGVTYTVPTAGDDDYHIYLPISLPGSGGTLDLGLSNVNPSNIAYGVRIGASAEVSTVLGAKAGVGLSRVNFLQKDFANYDYYYAENYLGGSTGIQQGLSGNLEGSLFLAYYTGQDIPTPSSFEGASTERSLSFDLKAVAGLGINIGGFTNDQWQGIIIGGEVGAGEATNLGSFSYGQSNSTLLNNQIETNQRSSFDRFHNKHFGIAHAIYQYLNK